MRPAHQPALHWKFKSAFVVLLILQDFQRKPTSPGGAGAAQSRRMAPSHEFQVVIVEDSHMFAQRLRAALGEIPQLEIVGSAETPSEAIETIGAQKPDLVLMDINLRGGSGIDVLRAIKDGGFPGVALMMTSQPSEPIRTACLQLKAAELFDKAEPEELLAAVTELASKTRSNQAERPESGLTDGVLPFRHPGV